MELWVLLGTKVILVDIIGLDSSVGIYMSPLYASGLDFNPCFRHIFSSPEPKAHKMSLYMNLNVTKCPFGHFAVRVIKLCESGKFILYAFLK